MLIDCPHCGTKLNLPDGAFAGRPTVRGRCGKCQQIFSAVAPTQIAPQPVVKTAVTAPAAAPKPPRDDQKTRVSGFHAGAGQLPLDKVVSLSVTEGPARGKLFRITKPVVSVGRVGTDIVIDDPEISRKHCALVINGQSATLTDLGTTNGTLVEGQRIATHELHHLSEFRIGASTVMFMVTAKEAGNQPV
jgi:pSer/pThr/pTyr-binding forkhead associated (FHA) protein